MYRAGFSTVDISGAIGMNLSGYMNRDHGNEGIHDPVYVKAMILEIDGKFFAISSGDYIGVNEESLNYVREKVNCILNIPKENIVLCATHTHSSYQGARVSEDGRLNGIVMDKAPQKIDYSYFSLLKEKIVSSFIEAFNNLEEVKLGYGIGEVKGAGLNRNNPLGYIDDSLHVLRVMKTNGDLLGVLVEFPCHPTVLSSENYLVSSDFPGYLRDTIEMVYKDSTCIYIQGTAGETSTRYIRRGQDFKEARRIGNLLAGEALKLISTIEDSNNWEIKSKSSRIRFNAKDYGKKEDRENFIKEHSKKLEEMRKKDFYSKDLRKEEALIEGAKIEGIFNKEIDFNYLETLIQVTKLGEFTFIGLPGEAFGEIGRDIKEITGEKTMVTGYCNDYVGYLVSKEGLKENIYEKSMMIFDENVHDDIVDKVRELYFNL